MRRMEVCGLLLLAAAAAWSCGADATAIMLTDLSDTSTLTDHAAPDQMSDGLSGVDARWLEDNRWEADLVEPDVSDGDSLPLPDPGFWDPGQIGFPCDSSVDCLSGYCIQTPDGKLCTMNCEEECPFEWECVLYVPSMPDQVYICAPTKVDLCKPCNTNADCISNDVEQGQACVPYGPAGSFCGAPCGGDDCPAGFACKEVVDAAGETVNQCVLADPEAECKCSEWAADEAASTACFVENEDGKCAGERSCTAGGLAPCSAPTPAEESCNGIDDDCDGEADEGLPEAECDLDNEFGTCTGMEVCEGGELVCEGNYAEAEACDGMDNNCDGATDEGFTDTDEDGTADCMETDKDGDGVPDVEDNCPSEPNEGQEDLDGDKVGDACDPDVDGDGIPQGLDNCPLDFNPQQGNIDNDDLGDACDPDMDGDGVDNSDDNCPEESNAQQEDMDNDLMGDACDDDMDGDEVPNQDDNCPEEENEDQLDTDNDGIGDACEDDIDNDLVPDEDDNCELIPNPDQLNNDGDALGDACDDDDDNDGEVDGADCMPFDPDVNSNAEEVCDGLDNNCSGDVDEGFDDSDQDGEANCVDSDDDNDLDPDEDDCAPLDPAVHAGAEEVCNNVDDDCANGIDDGFGTQTCGLGVCEHTVAVCLEGQLQECDPMEGTADEVCDGIDNNCNGESDEGYDDTDQDGEADCVDDDDDGDGVEDEDDNCPADPNPGQEDANGNGVGDACDPNLCGDGELQGIEECDDGNMEDCDGCASDCTAEPTVFGEDLTGPLPDSAFSAYSTYPAGSAA